MLDRLEDCCWVEIEGEARLQLVLRRRLRPAIYAVGDWLYAESGSPLAHNPEAPRILLILPPRAHDGKLKRA
ncbi:MAG: hypothetical protein ACTHLA_07835 [Asticcacaulis sp.]|jgi:hypothetical protein|uniref:hypothetical protein n=1 Tax=Asticcacaulis sp. TaxID=1872648 RepID=UPI003F7C2BAA